MSERLTLSRRPTLLAGVALALLALALVMMGRATPSGADPGPGYQLIKIKGVNWTNWSQLGSKAVIPGGKAAITLSGGYPLQNNDKIITSGLPNVGVGTYVYLEGASTDADGDKIVSWAWATGGPDEQGVPMDWADAQMARFMASKAGKYLVQLTVTDAKGQKSVSDVNVWAGKYVGVDASCALCHNGSVMPDMVSEWRETGHATKFETTYDRYSATSDYCARCHTVGYDETADNGGMDDAARAAGWDPKVDGSMLAWMKKIKNFTIGQVKADPNMGPKINIQCENCHGPGGSSHTKAKSLEAGVCLQCHDKTHGAQGWPYSKHAQSIPGTRAANTDCVSCHTAQGFVEVKIRGEEPVFPSQATAAKEATLPAPESMAGLTCATCHDPHAFNEPEAGAYGLASKQLRVHGPVKTPQEFTVDAGEAAICVTCHANKRDLQYKADFLAGKLTRGPHGNTQADVLFGKGAVDYGREYYNSFHTTGVENACITCHMADAPLDNPGPDGNVGTRDDVKVDAVGTHSFAVKAEWDYAKDAPDAGKVEVMNTTACQKCHGESLTTFNRKARDDFDRDGAVEGVQDEVKGLLAELAKRLPKTAAGAVMSSGVTAQNTTEAQRKAMWNYFLIQNDGSYGVHNTQFTVELLRQTIKETDAAPKAGAAAGSPSALPKTGSPIPPQALSSLAGLGVALVGLGGLFVRRRAR